MASLMQIARQTAEDFRDGIPWVAVWKTGRGWHAETMYTDPVTEEFELEEDESFARDIVKIDPNAKFLNGEIHGVFYEDSPIKEIADGICWLYEKSGNLLSDMLESKNAKEATKDGNLQELEHLVSVYDDYVRSGDFQTVLFKSEKGWCLQGFLYEDSNTFSHHLPRFESILQTDEKALFLNAVDGDRFPDDMTNYEIAAVLFDMYEKQENVLALETKHAKETVNAQKSDKERATTGLDEEKIIERINAMPIEELMEIVKKSFEDSHIPYTIEEGGKILFPGIFTDKSRSPPDEE